MKSNVAEATLASLGESKDAEIAVCIAAVSCYMKSEEQVSMSDSSSSLTDSAWAKAARLEDTDTTKRTIAQRFMMDSCRTSLWQRSSRPLLLILLLFFHGLCCYSQNARFETSSSFRTSVPKKAMRPNDHKPTHLGRKLLERIFHISKSKKSKHANENKSAQQITTTNERIKHPDDAKPKQRMRKFLERIWFISRAKHRENERARNMAKQRVTGTRHDMEAIEPKQAQESSDSPSNLAKIYMGEQKQLDRSLSIKVALALNCARVDLDTIDGAEIRQAPSGNRVAILPPLTSWSVKVEGNILAFNSKANRGFSQTYKPTGQAVETKNLSAAQLAYVPSLFNPRDTLPEQLEVRLRRVAYYPATPLNQMDNLRFPLTGGHSYGGNNKVATTSSHYFVVPCHNESGTSVFALNGKLYRGSLWLKINSASAFTSNSNLSAINIVELEDYLLSVVPSEMPYDWPSEALRAQAIAARSYAIANIGKHAKEGYDVQSSVNDQVYSGVSSETERTNRAVAETEGLVLRHKGEVISAFFHSTSGGATELAENVWGKSVPFVQSVSDYDDCSPYFSWQRQFTSAEIEAACAKRTNIGKLRSVQVISRSSSQRSLTVELNGTKSTHLINGETLRHLLHLPSTIFHITCDNGTYTFSGRGYGHGVGLSQWGAKALAQNGYNAAQILTYYYKDVSLTYLNETPGI